MKKYLGIPALATLTTLAALAVTGCGTPTSPAAVTTPDAQQLASCQYANNNCPLGHAYKMYGNVGRPTQYSYTVTANKMVTEPGNIVKVEFTIRGLTGTAGDDAGDSAGQNASIETSIGKTRYAFTDDFTFDGAASGRTVTGWVTFNPLPDGVTAQAIQWDNQSSGPVTWVVDWSSGY
jgi:hypothetical protein